MAHLTCIVQLSNMQTMHFVELQYSRGHDNEREHSTANYTSGHIECSLPYRDVGQLLYTWVYPQNIRVQQCTRSDMMCSCTAYTLVSNRTWCVCYQMDPWQRNQSSVEREVGQQKSILDRERGVVGGWVTSWQELAHIVVFSLLPASHTDFQLSLLSCLSH